MRLLNLWPNNTTYQNNKSDISSLARLIKEIIFTGLLLTLICLSIYAYLTWKTDRAQELNLELEQNLARMQKQDTSLELYRQSRAYLDLRAQHQGELDWLIGLIKLTDQHVKLVHVAQKEGVLTINGQANHSGSARQVVERINQVFPQHAPIIELLESKVDQDSGQWVFTVQLNEKTSKVVQ